MSSEAASEVENDHLYYERQAWLSIFFDAASWDGCTEEHCDGSWHKPTDNHLDHLCPLSVVSAEQWEVCDEELCDGTWHKALHHDCPIGSLYSEANDEQSFGLWQRSTHNPAVTKFHCKRCDDTFSGMFAIAGDLEVLDQVQSSNDDRDHDSAWTVDGATLVKGTKIVEHVDTISGIDKGPSSRRAASSPNNDRTLEIPAITPRSPVVVTNLWAISRREIVSSVKSQSSGLTPSGLIVTATPQLPTDHTPTAQSAVLSTSTVDARTSGAKSKFRWDPSHCRYVTSAYLVAEERWLHVYENGWIKITTAQPPFQYATEWALDQYSELAAQSLQSA